MFRRKEIINWEELQSTYTVVLRQGTVEAPPTDVFAMATEDGEDRWQDLKKRVVEHVSIARQLHVHVHVCDL